MKTENTNKEKKTIKYLLKPRTEMSSALCEMCKKREAAHEHHVGKDEKDREKRKIYIKKLDKKELIIYKKLEKRALKENPEEPKFFECDLCHSKIHNIEPKRNELKDKVVLLNRLQQSKFANDNRILSFGRIEMVVPQYYLDINKTFLDEEKKLIKEIYTILEKGDHNKVAKTQEDNVSFPIYNWLKKIKGIGPLHAAYLIGYIDIGKTPSVAALWAFCGQTPDSKLKKGRHINWSPVLKQRCFNIADSLTKLNYEGKKPNKVPLKYRKIYDKEKEKQMKIFADVIKKMNKEDLATYKKAITHEAKRKIMDKYNTTAPLDKINGKCHSHNKAKRKMIKAFLKDLWIEWNNTQKETNKNLLKPIVIMSPSKDAHIRQKETRGSMLKPIIYLFSSADKLKRI